MASRLYNIGIPHWALHTASTGGDNNFLFASDPGHANSHYWMTGTVLEKNDPEAIAHLWNVNNNKYSTLGWSTFPERLQAAGIPRKYIQVNSLTNLQRSFKRW